MSNPQFFYVDKATSDEDAVKGFFKIINTHAKMLSQMAGDDKLMNLTSDTIEAARTDEIDAGFKDPLVHGSKLFRVTVERVNG